MKKPKILRLFLASSSELASDRDQFEIFINRKNKDYKNEGVFLELILWEDFIDSMSQSRLQDEYNEAIESSDIFVSLFHTKVGKYTEEEFLKAFETFHARGRPLIYTCFKDTPVNVSQLTDEILPLLNFKKRLKDLGHFPTIYSDINDLKYKFSMHLPKIKDKLLQGSENDEQKQKHRKIFISYSHQDKKFLERLLIHLKPLVMEDVIDLWVDTKLSAGEKWQAEIENSLQTASVVILLVSADFLASEFIVNNELPQLLTAAEEEGTRIIPIIVKPCRYTRDRKLSKYQTANPPDRPLIGLSEVEQEQYYDKVGELVEALLGTK